jgi:hypothetical protein
MTNRTRIVLLGLFAVLIAVWGSSASLLPLGRSDDRAERRATDRAEKPVPSLFDVEQASSRLREHQRESPAPQSTGRNPFMFGGRAVTAASVIPAAPPADAVAPPPPDSSQPAPLFSLSGVVDKASDQGAGEKVTVRTAVISGLGQLYFAKVGDNVTARYTVTKIGVDVVELRDVATGETLRLALH